ncbi:MAG: hypothetical protein ACRYFX_04385 [Janthinobacterium lividum]
MPLRREAFAGLIGLQYPSCGVRLSCSATTRRGPETCQTAIVAGVGTVPTAVLMS